MRIIALIFFSFAIFCLGGFIGYKFAPDIASTQTALQKIQLNPKPLNRYRIENLGNADMQPGNLVISKEIDENADYSAYLVQFTFTPEIEGNAKMTTGLLNLPKNTQGMPLIILIRGYVDPSIYQTGIGTNRVGKYLASQGFITLAPDYLGYAGSDSEAGNIFETRFQTYTTTISLINTLENDELPPEISTVWDHKLGIWAHSNGGQIALTTLAATQKPIPTVLWAPVTKPFPYSVLYYTDESADEGTFLRHELAKFENLYLASEFSFTNYLERIHAPIQIHQGSADDAVPAAWSGEFVNKLKAKGLEVEYFSYPGSDHNLMPSWPTAVERSVEFFQKHL